MWVQTRVSVLFIFHFSSWMHLAQLKYPLTFLEHWLVLWVQDWNQRPQILPFWPQVVPALLFCFSGLVPAFPTHFSQLTSSPAPACTSCPTPSQPWLSPVPGGSANDTNLGCPPPSPLPVSWRQSGWWNRQDHPRPKGKGIGQTPGKELAQGEDLSWIWPRASHSWVCLISSFWDSCTCNPKRILFWLQAH